MKEHIQLTIKELSLRRSAIEQELDELRRTEEVIRRLDDEPDEPMSLDPSPAKIAPLGNRPDPAPNPVPPKKENIPHHRGSKKTHYKGVKISKPLADGTLKYEAQTRENGRYKYLGIFTSEELAAAAVAEAEGNPAEAERLRRLGTPKETKPAGRRVTPATKQGHKAPRPLRPGQRFKGVKPAPQKDGSTKYRTTYWDGDKGKNMTAGTFEDEIDAAMAVAVRLKDKAEIGRIKSLVQQKADQIEQKENNPDRPPRRQADRDEEQLDKTPQIWECENCFKQYIQTEPPVKCLECQHIEFRAIV